MKKICNCKFSVCGRPHNGFVTIPKIVWRLFLQTLIDCIPNQKWRIFFWERLPRDSRKEITTKMMFRFKTLNFHFRFVYSFGVFIAWMFCCSCSQLLFSCSQCEHLRKIVKWLRISTEIISSIYVRVYYQNKWKHRISDSHNSFSFFQLIYCSSFAQHWACACWHCCCIFDFLLVKIQSFM